jgi:hypothetical protein
MTRVGLVLIALIVWPGFALADKMLSGEDAAYIDWAVNNCGVKSTDKEHAMVEYQGTDLSDARSSPGRQAAMCGDIKTWYGPYGSRFIDLIKWDSSSAAPASDKSTAATAGRKGRHRTTSQ